MRSLHKLPEACSQDIFVQDRKYACFLCFFCFFLWNSIVPGAFSQVRFVQEQNLWGKKKTCIYVQRALEHVEKRLVSLKRDLNL